MKYLAILKDSFREALDTKVFYVLAAISLLVVIFIGSIGYTPAPADEAIAAIVKSGEFRLAYSDRGKSIVPVRGFCVFNLKGSVEAVSGSDSDPASSRDLQFTLEVIEFGPDGFDEMVWSWSKPPRIGNDPVAKRGIVSDDLRAEFLRNQFYMAGNLDVQSVTKVAFRPGDPKAVPPTGGTYVYKINTRGASGVRGWPQRVSLGFGLVTLPEMFQTTLGRSVHFIESTLIGGLGAWIAILVGVVITAFFIPNMLHKGTIDMLLSKPIHRATLLIYKYIGGLTFIFMSSVIAIGGTWLVLGLRSGIWAPGFLVMIFSLTYFFAILYSVSTLFAVLTRSPIVSIMMTCLTWLVLWLFGLAYQTLSMLERDETFKKQFTDNGWGWAFTVSDVVHAVLPRTTDLGILATKAIAQCLTEAEAKALRLDMLPEVNWAESIGVSGVFIAVMLGLACWRFSAKDY